MPVAAPRRSFRAVTINCWGGRWGGGSKAFAKRLPRLVARIRRSLNDTTNAAPSIVLATELSASEARALCAALGPGWRHVTYLYSSILYKGWLIGRKWSLTWNRGTHGAIICELSRDGLTINAISTHLPPFAWRAKVRRQCMDRLAAFLRGWRDPVLIGGDFNWRSTLESHAAKLGFVSARVQASTRIRPTYRTNGAWKPGTQIDYILSRGLILRGYRVLRGWHPVKRTKATDHHMATVQATIPTKAGTL